jgi:P-type conjugative transfer protein TrbJ
VSTFTTNTGEKMSPSRARKLRALLVAVLIANGSSALAQLGSGVVFDPTNYFENLRSAVAAVEQAQRQLLMYQTQLKQYELMIRDSAAPAVFVWDKANGIINTVRATADAIHNYERIAGDLETYLARFKDLDYYRRSPCYSTRGITENCAAQMREQAKLRLDSQKTASDAMLKSLQAQQRSIDEDSRSLGKLQHQAEDARGQLAAIQATNQLASATANQLIQIRSLLASQQLAYAASQQAELDRQAQQTAADEAWRAGEHRKTPERVWHVAD